MKLFFFGGCFNPPHIGHIKIIRRCLKLCDKFILLPTLSSPLKGSNASINPHHILNMLNLIPEAIDNSIIIDDYDLYRSGPTYTIDTIRYLQAKFSKYSINMVIGADQLIKLKDWKNSFDITSSIDIIVFNRKNCNFGSMNKFNFNLIEDFYMDISSKRIRNEIATGKLNEDFLIPPIIDYIFSNKLYGFKE